MGWSTELWCRVSFNRETYNTKWQVEQELEELNKSIERYKKCLCSLAVMTEPNKFFPEEEDLLFKIESEIMDTLEMYELDIYKRDKLELLLENWDYCHNEKGLAIDPPENIDYNTAYLWGDFVHSVKYPNENSRYQD